MGAGVTDHRDLPQHLLPVVPLQQRIMLALYEPGYTEALTMFRFGCYVNDQMYCAPRVRGA